MDHALTRYIQETFEHVRTDDSSGCTFFFYDPRPEPPHELYFATLEPTEAGAQLNIGIGKASFDALIPASASHDATTVDVLMPHPYYAGAHWVSVIEPGARTLEVARRLLAEAHGLAAKKHARRTD